MNPNLITFDIYRARSTARFADPTCLPRAAWQFLGTVAARTKREAFELAAKDAGTYRVVANNETL